MKTVNDVCKELERLCDILDKLENAQSDRIVLSDSIYVDDMTEMLGNYRSMLLALPIKQ